MRSLFRLGLAGLVMFAALPPLASAQEEPKVVRYLKTTPILLADDVAACVVFWSALGLEATMSVPEGDGIGFAMLSSENIELMYQSFTLARSQRPDAVEKVDRGIVFLEVASLDQVLPSLANAQIVVPEHTTDYGSREIYVRDPAGNLIGFSEPGE